MCVSDIVSRGASDSQARHPGEQAKSGTMRWNNTTNPARGWLNEGAFSLTPNPEGRAEDRYGRSLLVASRGGANVAEVLLAEGLAERRGGRRNVWC